jgi:hypothetical protein
MKQPTGGDMKEFTPNIHFADVLSDSFTETRECGTLDAVTCQFLK